MKKIAFIPVLDGEMDIFVLASLAKARKMIFNQEVEMIFIEKEDRSDRKISNVKTMAQWLVLNGVPSGAIMEKTAIDPSDISRNIFEFFDYIGLLFEDKKIVVTVIMPQLYMIEAESIFAELEEQSEDRNHRGNQLIYLGLEMAYVSGYFFDLLCSKVKNFATFSRERKSMGW